MNKAVCLRRADGPFVEIHSVQRPTLDARDLRADQCGAVLEILRAILSPEREPLMVFAQGF